MQKILSRPSLEPPPRPLPPSLERLRRRTRLSPSRARLAFELAGVGASFDEWDQLGDIAARVVSKIGRR